MQEKGGCLGPGVHSCWGQLRVPSGAGFLFIPGWEIGHQTPLPQPQQTPGNLDPLMPTGPFLS